MNQIKFPAQSPPLDTLVVAVVIVNAHIKDYKCRKRLRGDIGLDI